MNVSAPTMSFFQGAPTMPVFDVALSEWDLSLLSSLDLELHVPLLSCPDLALCMDSALALELALELYFCTSI